MTQSLGPSLSAMGSSAPHPAAETRRRGTSRWSSVTQTGLEFHWSFSPSVHPPLLHQGDHMLWTAQGQRLLDRLSLPCHCQPTSSLPQVPAPGEVQAGTRPEEAAGPRGKRLHWVAREPCPGCGGDEGWTSDEPLHGGQKSIFLYHCVCPTRPTHRDLLSPGSQ